MSAETLRKAATAIRADYSDPENAPFENAVANWLEEVAERQKPSNHWDRRSHGWTGSKKANAVARAYLGSDDA